MHCIIYRITKGDIQMKNFTLYITYWAPNGTHDLLIFNNDTNELVDCIEEACFGIRTNKPDMALMDGYLDDVSSLDDAELVEAGIIQPLYEISIVKVVENIAVSPVSDGSQVYNKLKALNLV